jgi:hypothetical protein
MADDPGSTEDGTDGRERTTDLGAAATPHGSSVWKVLGEIDDPGAIGVLGHNTATTGTSVGVSGVTDSPDTGATGVRGRATGTSGRVYGVAGRTDSADPVAGQAGVYGEATAASGWGYGVHGVTNSDSINAAGVRAEATDAQGLFAESERYTGVSGVTGDGDEVGVFGINNADTTPGGTGYGVSGLTDSAGDESAGVYGTATAATGRTYGVHGTTPAPGFVSLSGGFFYASGVRGEATATSGVELNAGVYGTNDSTSGTGHGVYGNSNSKNPAAAGVYALGGVNTGEAAAVSARGRVDVRDVGAMAYRSSNQTIDSGVVDQLVEFDSVKRDDFGGFAATSTTGVYEVQVDGDYVVEWQIDWASGFSSADVDYELLVDGLADAPGFFVNHTEDGTPVRNFSKPLYGLSTGDTIGVEVFQDTGTGKDIEGYPDSHDTFLSVRKFG